MSEDWRTKNNDLQAARHIMEEYANERNSNSLGLFEIVVDTSEKRMDYCLSGWVILIAKYFNATYGPNKGSFVTRQVITSCITQGQTLH